MERVGPSNKYKFCDICGVKDIPIIFKKINPGIIFNGEEIEYRFEHPHNIDFYTDKLNLLFHDLDILSTEHKSLSPANGYDYFRRIKEIIKKSDDLIEKVNFVNSIIDKLKLYHSNH